MNLKVGDTISVPITEYRWWERGWRRVMYCRLSLFIYRHTGWLLPGPRGITTDKEFKVTSVVHDGFLTEEK
jgi:hypothetical protein